MSTSTKRIVAAVVLLAVGAGIGLGVAAMVGGDDEAAPRTSDLPTETTTTVERPDEDLNPEAAELYDLVDAFADVTVHVRYRVEVAARPDAGSIIEIWQKDGKVRQEATVEDGAGAGGKVAMLDLGDRVVLCQQPPDAEYTCGLVSDTQATSFDELRANLLAGLAGQEVEASDETIDGRDVRCFAVEEPSASELCATETGIIVRITAAEGSFELLDVETEVDDAVFTPPAPPGVTAT